MGLTILATSPIWLPTKTTNQSTNSVRAGNNLLGEFTIDGIERGKRDTCKVEVMMEVDANGILTVTAQDKVTRVVAPAPTTRYSPAAMRMKMTYSNFFLIPDEIVSSRSEPTHALRTWVATTLTL